MATYESKEITWEAPEFEYRNKEVSWYWLSIIVAVICIGFAAWQKNFLFGLFILVAEILILAWANQQPAMFHFRFAEKGLHIGEKKFYPYGEMEAFSCHSNEENPLENLVFKFHSHLRRPVRILIPKNRLEEARSFLAEQIPETTYEPTLMDTIEEFVGF